jgi:hypothetical protein
LGKGKYEPTDLERARDELFSHIQRCAVLAATPDQQEEWLEDTVEYLAERYPALSRKELAELRTLGDRYCRPAIPHGDVDATEAWSGDAGEVEEVEEVVEPEAVDKDAVEARPAPDAEVPAS